MLLGSLLLSNQLLHFNVLVTLKLGLKTLQSQVLLGCSLLLELLVLDLSESLGLIELLLLVIEVLSDVLELLNLDLLHFKVDSGVEDLFAQLSFFSKTGLVLSQP